MKKFVILTTFVFIMLISFGLNFSFGQTIGFDYNNGIHYGKGCPVSADIVMDANGKNVATTDIILQSNMKFVDFVPNKELFPYFFPPVINSKGLVHIVGFTVFNDQIITGTGMIGTIYYQTNATDTDASIKFYFAGKGKTTDTNLSYGGVDQLESVGQAFFVVDKDPCVHEAAVITGGFEGISYMAGLDNTINQLDKDYENYRLIEFIHKYLLITILLLLLVVAIVLGVINREKIKNLFIKPKLVGRKRSR